VTFKNWRILQRKRVQLALEKTSHPRVLLFFMLAWSIVAAVLASILLHHGGMAQMSLRYAFATAIGYGFFLVLVWSWLRFRSDPDGPDISWASSGAGRGDGSCDSDVAVMHPGGGKSGGGGASGQFGHADVSETAVSTKSEVASGVVDSVPGLGEGVGVVVFAGIAVFAVVVWIVSIAPVLLADILLESILLASLYRRWRRSDEPFRLQAAWRHTRTPFFLVLLLAGLLGAVVQWYWPEAETIGAIWRASP